MNTLFLLECDDGCYCAAGQTLHVNNFTRVQIIKDGDKDRKGVFDIQH